MAIRKSTSTERVWLLNGKFGAEESARDVPIQPLPFRIGRRSDLSLVIACPTVSSCHAEITLCEGVPMIHDLGSTNGTYVNGRRITAPQPLREGDRIQIANVVLQLRCETFVNISETALEDESDGALALLQFDRLMTERAVVPYYQPIVGARDLQAVGYELLGRSQLYGLQEPEVMFKAAAQLNLETELSRLCREVGLQSVQKLKCVPSLFVNTHPRELDDIAALEDSIRQQRAVYPSPPMTLEIHEKSVTDLGVMRRLRRFLNEMDIRLAYDDFGAGQARLVELAEVPPDYLKFDVSLIRSIDRSACRRQNMVASLVHMVLELGIAPVAEGIETAAEAEACRQLGFQWNQGFYFGRPQPISRLA